jgi:predicted DNA-binding helix-hairpin-helix protein
LKCDQYRCKYCFTSCAIKRKRTTFKPDELATTFVSLAQTKQVDGLFLSSGIVPDANTMMEKMLAAVERLRLREGYTGYIHLKLIPGASFEYIERAVELADRVSLNLEAANQACLTELAPDKEFASSMWGRLAWAAELMRRATRRPSKRGLSAILLSRSRSTVHLAPIYSRFLALARARPTALSKPNTRSDSVTYRS